MADTFELTSKAIVEIRKLHPKINGKWPGVTGNIICPECGKNLHYSVSSYNGHIWGKCETDKCLAWMM